ncbi:hypothetical protein [Pseudobacteroides cellulosolvens]|uniref:Uncharacterized protein n=1 Tax=Pseudobacteroides cellulosolvens ATCC 35603 = DSM 2933 TaxID=398512 RepID=A0A0L6JQN9_9FIRM|nr:hypothetical protein [Pseudobacteroides cellulosolvens]KNY27682.1 hypothetical protein Bccel_2953 [Pseudobacteroides cellulosolvens ATCC 35603 = DSM 2933]
MKISDIKATLYDIFGYLIPGILFIFFSYVSFNHFKGTFDNTKILKNVYSYMEIKNIIVISVFAYFIGHVLSTLSSLIVEKSIFLKFSFLSRGLKSKSQFSNNMFENFKRKYSEVFNLQYDDRDFRSVICYVESREPLIYSTAFVFLSFYGMARCIAFILSSFFICELIITFKYFSFAELYYCIGILLLALVFYYEYYRFFRYFKQEIIMGFVLPKQHN